MAAEPSKVSIRFCVKCRFTLRATWLAQELCFTFGEELAEVALLPASGGVFEVFVGEELIWARSREGRFPEPKELKQLVRDRVAPGKDLGHSEARAEGD